MSGVDLGSVVPLSWTSVESGAATVTVKAPDGTAVSTTNVADTGATHTSSFVAAQAGRYLTSWAIPGAETYTDIVDVWPADPRFLISLEDAKSAINLSTTDAVRDADIRLYIAAVTPVIEDITGPVLVATRTKVADASRTDILLDSAPVTITSVEVDGVAFTQYTANDAAGIVSSTGRDFGGDLVVITYTVGSPVVPPNIRLAAREEVRFLWQIGKQGARPSSVTQDSATAYTPSGFAVPKRVIELCSPNQRYGSFG